MSDSVVPQAMCIVLLSLCVPLVTPLSTLWSEGRPSEDRHSKERGSCGGCRGVCACVCALRSLWFALITMSSYYFATCTHTHHTHTHHTHTHTHTHTCRPHPHVSSYALTDVYQDLLQLAARSLIVGGRLVYWMPVIRHE